MKTQGILVGADITQEWLLPWWWDHYSKHNSYPVAFIDFGLSFEMKEWCKERGTLIALRMADFVPMPDDNHKRQVEAEMPEMKNFLWDKRVVWFKKPFACLSTPFDQTIWIDADCEIKGSLEPIFSYCRPSKIAIAQDIFNKLPNMIGKISYTIYNSGVVAFESIPPLVHEWAKNALEKSGGFLGDQELLSWLVRERKELVEELPLTFNYFHYDLFPRPENVLIQHWAGNDKSEIQKQINEKKGSLPSWLLS